ncbi:hypothetical protein KFK09_016497 [Dendrobium nobile]|uniref:Reverse transcriptase Ty1/copia-type domain-containing protein n=1 Tax=Dendrobium nobile TaxID=94219 RepID=A0A8T3B0U3_DENNO|nr:hypothetical protein KFK09_016497 [Dendrobium nobile]
MQTGAVAPTEGVAFPIIFIANQCAANGKLPSSKYPHWRAAMASEFLALQQQGTWLLPVLGCCWTFKIKRNADGSIARYKARLVAQGNHQEYCLNYIETFSPVAKFPSIRVLLTIVVTHQCPIHQLDVTNVFLHGSLHDTIHMHQPCGFEDTTFPNHVYLLQKSLYDLK